MAANQATITKDTSVVNIIQVENYIILQGWTIRIAGN